MAKKASKDNQSHYGIAEWYGKDIRLLSPVERVEFGKIALRKSKTEDNPLCPFMSSLLPNARCNKKGGVCSIRLYDKHDPGEKEGLRNFPVILCPSRFIQRQTLGPDLFNTIAEVLVDSTKPIIVKETPFLKQVLKEAGAIPEPSDAQDEKMAGRIDWILVHPESEASHEMKWCALETQAVYFSGNNMGCEFEHYAQGNGDLSYPVAPRRPDYRSNGPKRLAPQLQVKVPVLRRWGNKVAVMVDRYFFSQMGTLPEAYAPGKTNKDKRDNSEVIWFVVDFDQSLQLRIGEIRFANLAESIEALNATNPLNKDEFNTRLRQVMKDVKKKNKKVFVT